MKITPVTCLLFLAIYLLSAGVYAANVKVIGLFTDKALLIIDSQQKLLSKGQTFGGGNADIGFRSGSGSID